MYRLSNLLSNLLKRDFHNPSQTITRPLFSLRIGSTASASVPQTQETTELEIDYIEPIVVVDAVE